MGLSGRSMEPFLVDCTRYEDVCLSMFAKTEIFINHNNYSDPVPFPAGSWEKFCKIRSNLPAQVLGDLEEFFDGQSDRCKEIQSSFVKVRNINTT